MQWVKPKQQHQQHPRPTHFAAECDFAYLLLLPLLLPPLLLLPLPLSACVCCAPQVQYKNVMFTVWDVGGQEKLRPLW
jgi:hypothetical protein